MGEWFLSRVGENTPSEQSKRHYGKENSDEWREATRWWRQRRFIQDILPELIYETYPVLFPLT